MSVFNKLRSGFGPPLRLVKVEDRAYHDEGFGALVKGGGARADGATEGHPPQGNTVGVDVGESTDMSENVCVVLAPQPPIYNA